MKPIRALQPFFLVLFVLLLTAAKPVPAYAADTADSAGPAATENAPKNTEVILKATDDTPKTTITKLPNGYVSISFPVPGTTKEIYVAGLREDKAEEIREEVADVASDAAEAVVDKAEDLLGKVDEILK